MARDARHTLVIERPFDMRILCQGAPEQGRGIVTRLAMTREFDSLLSLQVLDVLLIERFAKCVAVRRLPPLSVRVRVTTTTAFRRHKHLSGNKRAGRRSCIPRRERIGPEFEIVCLCYLSGIGILVAVVVGICRHLPAFCECERSQGKQDQTYESRY